MEHGQGLAQGQWRVPGAVARATRDRGIPLVESGRSLDSAVSSKRIHAVTGNMPSSPSLARPWPSSLSVPATPCRPTVCGPCRPSPVRNTVNIVSLLARGPCRPGSPCVRPFGPAQAGPSTPPHPTPVGSQAHGCGPSWTRAIDASRPLVPVQRRADQPPSESSSSSTGAGAACHPIRAGPPAPPQVPWQMRGRRCRCRRRHSLGCRRCDSFALTDQNDQASHLTWQLPAGGRTAPSRCEAGPGRAARSLRRSVGPESTRLSRPGRPGRPAVAPAGGEEVRRKRLRHDHAGSCLTASPGCFDGGENGCAFLFGGGERGRAFPCPSSHTV